MVNRSLRFVCVLVTAVLALVSGIAVTTCAAEYDIESLKQQTLEYKINSAGASDIQNLIDGYITENAGAGEPDWYALCIAKENGYDFSLYISALEMKATDSNIKAVDRLRMAIAYNAVGGTALDMGAVVDETWNKLGIMSEIYALILYTCGDFSCETDVADIVESLLNRQLDDGGWALNGKYSDADVTAMTLQALSAFKGNSRVQNSIDKAVNRLSALQQSDGGYKSYGTANSESCSQVIIALCQLGINPLNDSTFVKNGYSPLDAMMSFQCSSGGFSHGSGSAENNISTVQAYEALTAVSNYNSSGSGLYNLKSCEISFPESPTNSVTTADNNKTDDKISQTTTASPEKPDNGTGNSSNDNNSKVDNKNSEPDKNDNRTDNNSETSVIETNSDDSSEADSTATINSSTTTTVHSSAINTETASPAAITSVSTNKTDSKTDSESIKTDKTDVTTVTNIKAGVIDNTDDNADNQNWKIYVYTTLAGALVLSQIYLIARKQLTAKKLIVSAAVTVVCAGAVHFINIQSPEEYYSRNIYDVQPDSITVTLSVSCENIKDKLDGDYMIIPETEVVLLESDSVFDVLERVLAYNRIPFDYAGSSVTDIYIKGINNVYEMDYGEMSGWMYLVNGEFPDCGCGSYELEDGDIIEWVYTLNIGRDFLTEDYSE